MKMRQVTLIGESGNTITTWLPAEARVKPGARLTISADDYQQTWQVAVVYETQMDQETLHKQQKWNNNI